MKTETTELCAIHQVWDSFSRAPETTKAKFTRGPWVVDGSKAVVGTLDDQPSSVCQVFHVIHYGDRKDREISGANAALIAAAGTSATQLEDAGYDSLETLRALPEIVGALEEMLSATEYPKGVYPQADWIDHA